MSRRKDPQNPLDKHVGHGAQLRSLPMPLPQGAAVPAGLQAILLPHHKYAGADLRRSYGEAIAILLDRYNGAKGKEGKQSAVKASVHSTHTLDGTVKPGQYETSRTALLILDGKALAASVFVSLGDIGEGGILFLYYGASTDALVDILQSGEKEVIQQAARAATGLLTATVMHAVRQEAQQERSFAAVVKDAPYWIGLGYEAWDKYTNKDDTTRQLYGRRATFLLGSLVHTYVAETQVAAEKAQACHVKLGPLLVKAQQHSVRRAIAARKAPSSAYTSMIGSGAAAAAAVVMQPSPHAAGTAAGRAAADGNQQQQLRQAFATTEAGAARPGVRKAGTRDEPMAASPSEGAGWIRPMISGCRNGPRGAMASDRGTGLDAPHEGPRSMDRTGKRAATLPPPASPPGKRLGRGRGAAACAGAGRGAAGVYGGSGSVSGASRMDIEGKTTPPPAAAGGGSSVCRDDVVGGGSEVGASAVMADRLVAPGSSSRRKNARPVRCLIHSFETDEANDDQDQGQQAGAGSSSLGGWEEEVEAEQDICKEAQEEDGDEHWHGQQDVSMELSSQMDTDIYAEDEQTLGQDDYEELEVDGGLLCEGTIHQPQRMAGVQCVQSVHELFRPPRRLPRRESNLPVVNIPEEDLNDYRRLMLERSRIAAAPLPLQALGQNAETVLDYLHLLRNPAMRQHLGPDGLPLGPALPTARDKALQDASLWLYRMIASLDDMDTSELSQVAQDLAAGHQGAPQGQAMCSQRLQYTRGPDARGGEQQALALASPEQAHTPALPAAAGPASRREPVAAAAPHTRHEPDGTDPRPQLPPRSAAAGTAQAGTQPAAADALAGSNLFGKNGSCSGANADANGVLAAVAQQAVHLQPLPLHPVETLTAGPAGSNQPTRPPPQEQEVIDLVDSDSDSHAGSGVDSEPARGGVVGGSGSEGLEGHDAAAGMADGLAGAEKHKEMEQEDEGALAASGGLLAPLAAGGQQLQGGEPAHPYLQALQAEEEQRLLGGPEASERLPAGQQATIYALESEGVVRGGWRGGPAAFAFPMQLPLQGHPCSRSLMGCAPFRQLAVRDGTMTLQRADALVRALLDVLWRHARQRWLHGDALAQGIDIRMRNAGRASARTEVEWVMRYLGGTRFGVQHAVQVLDVNFTGSTGPERYYWLETAPGATALHLHIPLQHPGPHRDGGEGGRGGRGREGKSVSGGRSAPNHHHQGAVNHQGNQQVGAAVVRGGSSARGCQPKGDGDALLSAIALAAQQRGGPHSERAGLSSSSSIMAAQAAGPGSGYASGQCSDGDVTDGRARQPSSPQFITGLQEHVAHVGVAAQVGPGSGSGSGLGAGAGSSHGLTPPPSTMDELHAALRYVVHDQRQEARAPMPQAAAGPSATAAALLAAQTAQPTAIGQLVASVGALVQGSPNILPMRHPQPQRQQQQQQSGVQSPLMSALETQSQPVGDSLVARASAGLASLGPVLADTHTHAKMHTAANSNADSNSHANGRQGRDPRSSPVSKPRQAQSQPQQRVDYGNGARGSKADTLARAKLPGKTAAEMAELLFPSKSIAGMGAVGDVPAVGYGAPLINAPPPLRELLGADAMVMDFCNNGCWYKAKVTRIEPDGQHVSFVFAGYEAEGPILLPQHSAYAWWIGRKGHQPARVHTAAHANTSTGGGAVTSKQSAGEECAPRQGKQQQRQLLRWHYAKKSEAWLPQLRRSPQAGSAAAGPQHTYKGGTVWCFPLAPFEPLDIEQVARCAGVVAGTGRGGTMEGAA